MKKSLFIRQRTCNGNRNLFLTILFLFLFTFPAIDSNAQNAYIQVNGEPGLSVFLNGNFKGKTSAEYNGYIIENVKPGQNLIKVVKEGYVPYEETVSVKPGEVFAYKVKSFSKHIISISEKGNSEVTDKKAEIVVGRLVVQSVPIELKITIDGVEGANMISKTKDQWTADKIPVGKYNVTFTFNNKHIKKTVEILGNGTTRVFMNMLNGEFTATNNLTEQAGVRNFCDSLTSLFYFQPGISRDQFLKHHPELQSLRINTYNSDASLLGFASTSYTIDMSYYQKQRKTGNMFLKGFSGYVTDTKNEVVNCSWMLAEEKLTIPEMESIYARITTEIKSKVPAAYWKELNTPKYNIPKERLIISVPDDMGNTLYYITYSIIKSSAGHNISLAYATKKNLAEW